MILRPDISQQPPKEQAMTHRLSPNPIAFATQCAPVTPCPVGGIHHQGRGAEGNAAASPFVTDRSCPMGACSDPCGSSSSCLKLDVYSVTLIMKFRSYRPATLCFLASLLAVSLLLIGCSNSGKDKRLRDYSTHSETVKKLAASKNPKDIALLINYVRNPPETKWISENTARIVEALADHTSEEVFHLLVDVAQQNPMDSLLLRSVAIALGNHPKEKSVETLYPFLKNPDPKLRAATISSLIKLRTHLEVPYLDGVPLIVDRDWTDRFTIRALAQDPDLPINFRHWDEWWFPTKVTSAGAYWNHGVQERGIQLFIKHLQARDDDYSKILLCLALEEEMSFVLHPDIIEKILEAPNPYIEAYLLDLFSDGSDRRYEHKVDLERARPIAAHYLLKHRLITFHEVNARFPIFHETILKALINEMDPEFLGLIYEKMKEHIEDAGFHKNAYLRSIEIIGNAAYEPATALLIELSKNVDFRDGCYASLGKIGNEAAMEYLLSGLNEAFDDFDSIRRDRFVSAILQNRNNPWVEQFGADLAVIASYPVQNERFLVDYACMRLIENLRYPVLRRIIAKRITPISSVLADKFIEILAQWEEVEAQEAIEATSQRTTCKACQADAKRALGIEIEQNKEPHNPSHTSYLLNQKFVGEKPISDPEEAIQALRDADYLKIRPALIALYAHPEVSIEPELLYQTYIQNGLTPIMDLCALLLTRQNKDDPRPLPLWASGTCADWIRRAPDRFSPSCFKARLAATFANNDYHLSHDPLDTFYKSLPEKEGLDIVLSVFEWNDTENQNQSGNHSSYRNHFFERILPEWKGSLQLAHLQLLANQSNRDDLWDLSSITTVTDPLHYDHETLLFRTREQLNDAVIKHSKKFPTRWMQPLWAEAILDELPRSPIPALDKLDSLWGYRNPLLLPAGPGVTVRSWEGKDPHDALDMLHFLKDRSAKIPFDIGELLTEQSLDRFIDTLSNLGNAEISETQYQQFSNAIALGKIPFQAPQEQDQAQSLKSANTAYKKADFQKAEALYKAIIREQPFHLKALNNLALTWFHNGQHASALLLWNWISRYSKDSNTGIHLGALTNRYAAEVYFGLSSASTITAQQIQDHTPDSLQSTYIAALNHFENGNYEVAKQEALQCQKKAPLFYRAHYLQLLANTQLQPIFTDPVLFPAIFEF